LLNKTIVKSAVKRTIEQDSKDKAPNFYNSRPVAIRAGNHYILRWAYTVQHISSLSIRYDHKTSLSQ